MTVVRAPLQNKVRCEHVLCVLPCADDSVRSVFGLSYWVDNSGSVHFTNLPLNLKKRDQGRPKKGQLSQPCVMSHAIYARGRGWCSNLKWNTSAAAFVLA